MDESRGSRRGTATAPVVAGASASSGVLGSDTAQQAKDESAGMDPLGGFMLSGKSVVRPCTVHGMARWR